jgi:hypothetical protein
MLKQLFPMDGFQHQNSYDAEDILLLTQHLVAKIVQDVK